MDLEGIKLSETSQIVRQRKKNTVWYPLYVETKKLDKLVNITKEKLTHRYIEKTSGSQRGEGSRKEQDRGVN